MPDIAQILHNNGFKYHKNPEYDLGLVVEDLEIVNFEQMIEYIGVRKDVFTICINFNVFTICINFKGNVPDKTNFGLNFDVGGYLPMVQYRCIFKRFSNENDFINELHRMNTIGANIKG